MKRRLYWAGLIVVLLLGWFWLLGQLSQDAFRLHPVNCAELYGNCQGMYR